MFKVTLKPVWGIAILLLLCGLTPNVHGGGSGLNTAVIINQASSNSCAVGNYFCERRQVPPDNVLFVNWAGGNISWNSDDFQTTLLTPLLAMLASRRLTNQVDYIVLSMDIPFQTLNAGTINSTTAALFYGLKSNVVASLVNSYSRSEQIFRKAPPDTAPGPAFLTTMLTANSVAQAKQMIDQGVNSDGTFPASPVLLAKSSDSVRNVRYTGFDTVVFNTVLGGNASVLRTNLDSPAGLTNIFGYETGLASFSVSPGTFVPGAMADSLTSYGGLIFGPNSQTTLLAFIAAGAAGSYGTVAEPTADLNKFPDPMVYFYQARGFSLAESYYQSVTDPFLGLIVGEPLAAPFQRPGSGGWTGIASNALLSGTAQLSVQFAAADADRPLQQIDLFVDGKYARTLTNVPPLAGNVVSLVLNGIPHSYTVPANATLASVASGLNSVISAAAGTTATNIVSSVHGDRIELHSLATNRPPAPGNLRLPAGPSAPPTSPPPFASSSPGAAGSDTTLVAARRSQFLNSPACGLKACTVSGLMNIGTWLQISVTKTNGALVTLAVTNQSATETFLDLTTQLANLINSAPGLQGPDGLALEDLVQGSFGANFNLRARSPGQSAARIAVRLPSSTDLVPMPSGQFILNDNVADLQPRNHIYIRAGASNLALAFPLDTTALPDGYHELTAIAYEGTHVHTQTRTTLPVRVQNSPLTGTMTFLDLPDPSPVSGTYHIQVAANTNNVSAISLFTTGGLLGTVANQSTATFIVNGPSLGAGLHPFYALIQTAAGLQYRVQPQSVHLQ